MADIVGTLATKQTLSGDINAILGKDGASAYEIALQNGFEGSETEWLESLKGADGLNGKDGTNGVNGQDGKDGVSATHSWNGTILTITSASGTSSANLKGDKGDKGEQGIQGIQGIQGMQGVQGEKGEKGEKGDKGMSGVYVGSGDMPTDCNVQIDLDGEVLTLEDIEELISDKLTSDNWCVIANTTLTENIGSEKALQKFFEVTTDTNGIPLSQKNIRHLRMNFYFPTSDDALYNGFHVRMSETAPNITTTACAADSYYGCQIDVVNENAAFVIMPNGTAKSYNSTNYIFGGDAVKEKSNLFGGKDKIEYISFSTNYPNGTILPVGTKIMITGW